MPHGDVELRRHRLAGLADLRRVRVPAGVDDRAGGRDGAAERACEVLAELEVVRRAEAAAAADEDVRLRDVDARLHGLLVADDARGARRAGASTQRRTSALPPVGASAGA